MHLEKPDPFHPASDPAAYVPRPASERALRELGLCLRGGALAATLLGPPGIGKTLLMRVLAERLEEDFRVLYLPYPHTAARELCRWALLDLGENPGTDAEGVLLQVAAREGPPMLLLLDDGDALPLGSARRLYELARQAGGRLRLVLAGADAQRLERILGMMADDLPVVSFDEPMSAEETAEYVLSRLELVEADEDTRALFSEENLRVLHRLSNGIPAVLHEHAMAVLTGHALPEGPPPPPTPSEMSWEAVVVEAERERRENAPAEPAPAAEAGPAAAPARPRPSTVLRGVAELEARAAARKPGSRRTPGLGRWLALGLGLAALVLLGRTVPPWLGAKLAAPARVEPVGPVPSPLRAETSPAPSEEPPAPAPAPVAVEEVPPALPREAPAAPAAEAAAPEVPVPVEAPRAALPAPPEPAPTEPAPAPAPVPGSEFNPVGAALGPLREELARRGALPPPPPAPEPAPAGAGADRVAVRITAPQGAVIEIDGRRAGVSPVEGISLPSGSYRFVARLPDGQVMQRTVSVTPASGEVVFP